MDLDNVVQLGKGLEKRGKQNYTLLRCIMIATEEGEGKRTEHYSPKLQSSSHGTIYIFQRVRNGAGVFYAPESCDEALDRHFDLILYYRVPFVHDSRILAT